MYQELERLQEQNNPIRLAITGCGHQGTGLALQTCLTPGLKLIAAIDLDVHAAREAAKASGQDRVIISNDYFSVLAKPDIYDVMIEASTSIESAAKYVIATLKKHISVILMNAELDLLLGPLLHKIAEENNTIISSDAGDQPGVISRMADEILAMGFELRMLGNCKGYLYKGATYLKLKPFAEQHYINICQCVAMTDGTKLAVEMALLANAFNARPLMPGMEGPRLKHVNEIIDRWDWGHKGCCVEYILGAKPGGGVFIIAETHDPLQQQYLNYYKMGEGPRYLFYRPYHLCHLETPRAILKAFLFKKKVMAPQDKLTDVYAFAKYDIPKNFKIKKSIGSDQFYGLIHSRDIATELVPIALLENEGKQRPYLKQAMAKDQPLKWHDVEIPDSDLWKLYQKQEKLLEGGK